jgi:hypothetical protein
MGMSTHVVGIRPPDEKWKRMKGVWKACVAADTPIPNEVLDFFDDEEPDEAGVILDLDERCCEEWSDEHRSGYEIDLALLPDDVTKIRFYNSW